jgi:hypothetical protein
MAEAKCSGVRKARAQGENMAAHEMHFLKIDHSMPDSYGDALWVPIIEGATPFEREADAQRVKTKVTGASGVVLGVDGYFYVLKVGSSAPV